MEVIILNLSDLRHIPMESIENFRSLGGYAGKSQILTDNNLFNSITKHGTLYRCACVNNTSENDIKTVYNLGIRTIIDLRSDDECLLRPNTFTDSVIQQKYNISHHHINLLKNLDPSQFDIDRESPLVLSQFYRMLLDHKQDILKYLIELISESLDKGAVLFHCTAGKDRTGITAMFLLSIAGVDELDIIADYQVSETYLATGKEQLGSNAENMKVTLEYLREEFGGPISYLKHIGVSDNVIQNIMKNILEKI